MFPNTYNMSDEEIEKLVDDYLNNTPKDQLLKDFEESGLFEEFKDNPKDIQKIMKMLKNKKEMILNERKEKSSNI